VQVEAGPEALHELTATAEELQASAKTASEQLSKLEKSLTATKATVDAQGSLCEAAVASAGDAGRAAATVGARIEAESKRLTAYCDKITQPLARSAQVRFFCLIMEEYF
jgi:ABC-type transporter Mla subunit MlaD